MISRQLRTTRGESRNVFIPIVERVETPTTGHDTRLLRADDLSVEMRLSRAVPPTCIAQAPTRVSPLRTAISSHLIVATPLRALHSARIFIC
jgi:hypothetical protein